MPSDHQDLIRAAIDYHIEVYGRYDLLPAQAEGARDTRTDEPVAAQPPAAENGESSEGARKGGPSLTSPYERVADLIPAGSPLLQMQSLQEVEAYVRDNELIPLDAERTNPVFGVGHPEADLLVIGEAPGADEDRQGEPFVGRAGQLLTRILASVGFDRKDVYIANILKSRPPNNRDPLPAEVEGHMPVLMKQIALIRPKIVLCVGRTAGNSLLGRSGSLKSMRGTLLDFHGVPVLVTYHPAALLRNSQWKRPTWEDVQLLRQHYDSLGGR